MATGNSGAGLGLQIAGLGAGLLGQLAPTAQSRQDRRMSKGQEDPAIAALRKRLAEQNAQTAMSVAASQQGVNPALAQRNAQQALAQQQVRTNAQLAQANQQSTQEARGATRGQQAQQVGGTLLGVAQGLNALGTGFSADAALDAQPDKAAVSLPEIPGAVQAPVAETAQGLTAPPPSSASTPIPVPESAQGLTAPVAVAPQEEQLVDAMNAAAPSDRQIPADQLQMRGAVPTLTAPAQPVASPIPQQVSVPAVTERPVGADTQEPAISASEQIALLPEAVRADPEISPLLQTADALESLDPAVAEALRRLIVGGLNG